MICAVADVGGTDTKLGIVSNGEILHSLTVPTPVDDLGALRGLVASFVNDADSTYRPQAAAMVVPGIVDPSRGLALFSENLRWTDVPFARWLTADTDLPSVLGHDVTAAGLAEHRYGAARGHDRAAAIVIGTGIAAALIMDGQVINRAGVGEIGHSIVNPRGPRCVCGAQGCLEAIASAAAISRAYQRRTGQTLSTAQIGRVMDTDADAAAVWNEAIDALAHAIRQLQALAPVEAIIIGGGLSLAGDRLLGPLRVAVEELLTVQPVPTILTAELGASAGMIGAAELAARGASREW